MINMNIIKSTDAPRGKLLEVKVNKKVIRIVLTWHVLDGASDYNISANELLNFLIYPEEVIRGHVNRFIAHKKLNQHLT